MRQRPISVTIVAWFLIVSALITAAILPSQIGRPAARAALERGLVPADIQIGLSIIGLALTLVCGVAMLKGKDWGRLAYVGWSAAALVLTAISAPSKTMVLPGLAVFLIIAFVLFRAPADAFFGRSWLRRGG